MIGFTVCRQAYARVHCSQIPTSPLQSPSLFPHTPRCRPATSSLSGPQARNGARSLRPKCAVALIGLLHSIAAACTPILQLTDVTGQGGGLTAFSRRVCWLTAGQLLDQSARCPMTATARHHWLLPLAGLVQYRCELRTKPPSGACHPGISD